MSEREVIEFSRAYIEVEARPGYLFVVESGQIVRMSELNRFMLRLEAVAKRSDCPKALIDARGEVGEAPPEVRDAMWAWLTGPERPFDFVAFVVPTEIAVARVNMTALSQGAPLRAFDTVQAAQRWLLRDPKISGASTQPRLSSAPPQAAPAPEEGEPKTGKRLARPGPGRYRASDVPADQVARSDSKRRGDDGSQVA